MQSAIGMFLFLNVGILVVREMGDLALGLQDSVVRIKKED